MFNIIIAGLHDCTYFVNASIIAHSLKRKIKNFRIKTILVEKQGKQQWIFNLNKEKNWNYLRLPIIWHEIGFWGGKSILIGGLTEFFEYCYENFGFDSLTPTIDKSLYYKIVQEKIEYNTFVKTARRTNPYHVRVCITNCTHPMAYELTAHLLKTKSIQWQLGCLITLYPNTNDPIELNKLKPLINDLKGIKTGYGIGATNVETNIDNAFFMCDVIIILDGKIKKKSDTIMMWLWRNYKIMADLGDVIQNHAKDTCFIINAAPDDGIPLCFNCQVLADFAPKIPAHSIIAITADLGFESVSILSKYTKIHRCDLLAPAVWGEMGINRFVDLYSTRYIYKYKHREGREIRPMEHLIKQSKVKECIYRKIKKRKKFIEETYCRVSYMSKLKATVDLIDIWFDLKEHKHFSATPIGILSDGTFGITTNMYFSQPAKLKFQTWYPCTRYNVPFEYSYLENMINVYRYYLRKFKVGTRFDAIWLKSNEELDTIIDEKLNDELIKYLDQFDFYKSKGNDKEYLMKIEFLLKKLITDDQMLKKYKTLYIIEKQREKENEVYQKLIGPKFKWITKPELEKIDIFTNDDDSDKSNKS